MDKKQKRLENITKRIDALNDVIERMQARAGKSSRLNAQGIPVNIAGEPMLRQDEVRQLEDNIRYLDELYEQADKLEA